jgi:hypothetical protein
MKFKKIFLHIGFDKTGSTALQKCLKINSDLLLNEEIFYVPTRYSTILGSFFSTNPKHFIFNKLKRSDLDIDSINYSDKKIMDIFISDLDKSNSQYLIISCESLAYLDKLGHKALYSFLKEYSSDIEIICYARSPVSYVKSAMSQRVKTGFTSWSLFNIPIIPYKKILTTLFEIYGKNNLTVKIYEVDSLINKNIIDDFIDTIDLNIKNKLNSNNSELKLINKSLSNHAIETGDELIFLLKNRLNKGSDYFNKIGNKLEDIIGDEIELDNQKLFLIKMLSRKDTDFLYKSFGISFSDMKLINKKKTTNKGSSKKNNKIDAMFFLKKYLPEYNEISYKSSNNRHIIKYFKLLFNFSSIKLFFGMLTLLIIYRLKLLIVKFNIHK